MKIIFLDIDGVLNSSEYRKRMGRKYYSEIIDRSKMPLLKKIVEATGAKIVLSTSWRKFWNEGESQLDAVGQHINTVFEEFGLSVHSKHRSEKMPDGIQRSGNGWKESDILMVT